ncbi:MAG: hypothetical protein IJR48_03230 [Oscillibacter sp.]|nr:hypothetical protein [Oscillibacter sp.]MBQ7682368.1 hypothetical protein [Oscillibacter sp.]MBQ9617355.1 hypothetical protein [Oscillibacter sp.]
MPYDEPSFFNGLAAGLTATAGRYTGLLEKASIIGMDTFKRYPTGNFETIVSTIRIQTDYPLTFVYEYGPDRNNPQREFRRIAASKQEQRIAHVVQLPEPLTIAEHYPSSIGYYYNVSYFRHPKPTPYYSDSWGDYYTPWGGLMLYPYEGLNQKWYFYPGSPELVDAWAVQTSWIYG